MNLVRITQTLVFTLAFAFSVISGPHTCAQPGWVLSHQKISDTQGGFTGILDDADSFGGSAATLGDLDGDDDGGTGRGAAWVLLLNTDGTGQVAPKDQRYGRRLYRHPG